MNVQRTARKIIGFLAILMLMPGCNYIATDNHRVSAVTADTAPPAKTKKPLPAPDKRLGRLQRQTNVPVLLYHKIETRPTSNISVTPAQFDKHLRLLSQQGYKSISSKQLQHYLYAGGDLPDKPVLITFDDGWKSQYKTAIPVLLKYKYKAVFFVNPDTIKDDNPLFMNTVELKDLSDHGFEIGSHTWSHHSLRRKGGETLESYQKRMRWELSYARRWLENKIDVPVQAIAYPYGFYDAWATSAVASSGFKLAFTVNEGANTENQHSPLLLKRYVMFSNTSMRNLATNLGYAPIPVSVRYPEDAAITGSSRFPISIQLKKIDNINMHTAYLEINHRRVWCVIKKQADGSRILISNVKPFRQGQYYAALQAQTTSGKPAIHSWSFNVSGDSLCVRPDTLNSQLHTATKHVEP